MAVILQKGQKIGIKNNNAPVEKITIGLGWQPNTQSNSYAFDLDASAFLLNAQGSVSSDNDFIFYNNPMGPNSSIIHSGNNITGSYINDAEQIILDLPKIPTTIQKIAITITIHEAVERRQNFGMISKAYVRIISSLTNEEIIYFDLSNQFSYETAIVAAEIYRYQNEWKFNATGAGFNGGLSALCKNFGVSVASEVGVTTTLPTQYNNNSSQSYGNSHNTNNNNNNNNSNYNYSNSNSPTYGNSYNSAPQSHNSQYVPPANNNYGQTIFNSNTQQLVCPRCSSHSISAGKKGFGVGKAAVGALILGPIGVFGGLLGSKNLEFKCISCSFKWTESSNSNTANWLKQQASNTTNLIGKYLNNNDLVDALISGSALISMADGVLDPSEKSKLMNYFASSPEFKSLNLYELEQKFNYFVQKIQFDNIIGKAEALRTVSKVRNKPDLARLVVRLCCAIGYADGDFGIMEKRMLEEICRELSLNPNEFVAY